MLTLYLYKYKYTKYFKNVPDNKKDKAIIHKLM